MRKPYRFNKIYECMSKHLGVKYIDDGMPEPEQTTTAEMSKMLSVLPEGLRYDLTEVLESLETTRIAQVIQQIATYTTQNYKKRFPSLPTPLITRQS